MDSILVDLNSDDEDRLRRGIESAAETADDEVVSRLVAIVRDDGVGQQSREAAALSLGSSSHDRATAALLEFVRDGNPKLREIAAVGLGAVHSRESMSVLLDALTDRVNTVRNVAERSLLGMPDVLRASGVERLLELLGHPVPLTRSPAARLLGITRDERGLAPLVTLLRGDTQWLSRLWAAKGLGDLGRGDAIDALADAMLGDEKSRVRAAAAEAIGKLRHERSRELLDRARQDEDGGVRKIAEEQLLALGGAGFEDASDPFAEDD